MLKRLWKWLKGLFVRKKTTPARTVISVPYVPKPEPKVREFKATKAYADERQKMKKNRKRHPSKKMRNIYKALER